MDRIHKHLLEQIQAVATLQHPGRIIVGIAGPPGSGKTTITAQLVQLLNVSMQAQGDEAPKRAVAVPMDGFHYTRAQLDQFPNSTEAHRRRGAPWTFDVGAVLNFVERVYQSTRQDGCRDIFAPSFDHATKDPVEDGICIPATASIVVLEGNYLLLNRSSWREITNMLDFRVLIKVSPDEARRRVAARHVASGIEPNMELAEMRYDNNDGPNGELILAEVVACDAVVDSVSWEMDQHAVG